jgi:hypothetical protein
MAIYPVPKVAYNKRVARLRARELCAEAKGCEVDPCVYAPFFFVAKVTIRQEAALVFKRLTFSAPNWQGVLLARRLMYQNRRFPSGIAYPQPHNNERVRVRLVKSSGCSSRQYQNWSSF